jgi:hypothetical protein
VIFATSNAAREVVTIRARVSIILTVLALDKVLALVRLFNLDLGVEN